MVLKWEQGKLWDDTPLKLCQKKLLIEQICYKTGSIVAVKIGQLGGNADTFMPIFFADTLGFLVRYISRSGNNTFFW